MKLIALKKMTYSTRHLVAGDPFDAKDMDARILVGTKKAMAATPPRIQEVRPNVPDIEALRATAKSLGIDVDNRWGIRRLQSEIDRKRAGADT